MEDTKQKPAIIKFFEKIKNFFFEIYSDKIIKSAVFGTIIFGAVTYVYLATNNIVNHDGAYYQPFGFGRHLDLGRWLIWMLEIIAEKLLGGSYNIPIFAIITAIICLAISSAVLVRIFNIKSRLSAIAISAIIVTSPAVATSAIYTFGLSVCAFSILLFTLAAYFAQKLGNFGYILSVFLIAASIGIYPGFFPFTATIYIIILVKDCIDGQDKFFDIFINALKYLSTLAFGFVIYLLINSFVGIYTGVEMSDYLGVDNMGSIDISLLPQQISTIYSEFFSLPFRNVNEFSTNFLMQSVYLVALVAIIATAILSIVRLFRKKEILRASLFLVLLISFPIAVNFIVIMVPYGVIHTLMRFPFVSIFILAVVLCENVLVDIKLKGYKFITSKLVSGVVAVFIFLGAINYSWMANGNFITLYYHHKHVEEYFSMVFNRAYATEGYNLSMPIFFVGRDLKGTIASPWQYTSFNYTGTYINQNLYSSTRFVPLELGHIFYYLEFDDEFYLTHEEEIINMPTYPREGSVRVIDGALIVNMVENNVYL